MLCALSLIFILLKELYMNLNSLKSLWTAGASRKEIIFSWGFAIMAFGGYEYYKTRPRLEINNALKKVEGKK